MFVLVGAHPRFDVFAVGTHRGAPRRAPDPLTGRVETRVPLVMTDSELAAARAVIDRYAGQLDGLAVTSFSAEGATIAITGELAPASSFLFEFVTSGRLLLLVSGHCITTTEDALARVRELDEEFGMASLARGPDELASLLARHASDESSSPSFLDD
jgi:hypothetical protein